MQRLGLVFIVASFLPWIAIATVVPWLPLAATQKAFLVPALLVLTEVLFWLGVVMAGKEAARKYKKYFSLRYLRKRWRKWQRRSYIMMNRLPRKRM